MAIPFSPKGLCKDLRRLRKRRKLAELRANASKRGNPPTGRARSEGKEMSSGSWSPDEDERLRKLAGSGFSLTEIAVQLQRKKSSVHGRAMKLKVALARDGKSPAARSRFWLEVKAK